MTPLRREASYRVSRFKNNNIYRGADLLGVLCYAIVTSKPRYELPTQKNTVCGGIFRLSIGKHLNFIEACIEMCSLPWFLAMPWLRIVQTGCSQCTNDLGKGLRGVLGFVGKSWYLVVESK